MTTTSGDTHLATAVDFQRRVALMREELGVLIQRRNENVRGAVAGGHSRKSVARAISVTDAQIRHIMKGRAGGRDGSPPKEFDL